MQSSPPHVTISRAPSAFPPGDSIARSLLPFARLEPPLEEVSDLLDAVPHGVALLDARLRYDYLNLAYAKRFGRPPTELIGRSLREMLGETAFEIARPTLERALAGELVRDRITIARGDGDDEILDAVVAPRRDASGRVFGCLAVLTDVTAHQRAIDELTTKLSHLTHHDTLTGLPNRTLFGDHLERTLARAERSGRPASVIALDLDDFNKINDSLGHDVGDALLVEVARRLEQQSRDGDVVARIGGDQFAILAPDLSCEADGVRIGQRLLNTLRDPVRLQGHEILVRASVGVSVCPRDSCEPSTMLRYADAAMHRAKSSGTNDVQCFSPEMMRDAAAHLALETRLQHAIEQGSLETWMQPQVDLSTRRVVGLEALSRWRDGDHGWVSPAVFIPVAMDAGLMVELGRHVLRATCRTIRRLDDEHLGPPRVAVNVAAPQVHWSGFVDDVLAILAEEGVAPQRIELEITESAVIKDVELVIERLEALREAGITISLDDFGTGYSSLTYLRRLPVDVVKIDKSFIDPIETDHTAAGIVTAIVSMAHWLGMTVVAEGVETEAQAELLSGMGCDVAQGYHFARPTPPGELPDVLRPGVLPLAR